MTASQVVRARVLELTDVTSIVGQKVYTNHFPQNFKAPGVLVTRIDQDETIHLRGAGGPVRARVQVDSVATTAAGAYALDAAVNGPGDGTGLAGYTGLVNSASVMAILPVALREDYEADELRQFRVSRDYFVTIREGT